DNSAGLKGSLNKVASGLNTSTIAAKLFGAAIGTAVIGASIAFVKLADTAGTMEAKLRIATGSAKAYATASADIVRIANESRSSLTATADLYLKTMRNADKLGLSQQGVALATSTFTKVLKVGGASAQEASSAILQLSQAMGAGVLQGDEFKSLMETAPEFMKILATSMDVPMGQLKKLGSEGKITGQQISKALTDPKIVADIEAQFGKIPRSFGDVTTSIQNTLVRGAGALFKGLGIETSLAVIIAHVNKFADKIE
ncbi:tape measure protein, partial [Kitasatospora cinereorecta]